MIKQDFRDLIDKLNEKTQNSQLVWNKTSSDNQFKLILNNATFVVTYNDGNYSNESVYVVLYDKKGERITIASEESGSSEFTFLYKFYENINSDYMQIPKTITSILEELDVDVKVGEAELYDYKLPF